ncbi:MAG: endolytic transglycosylase MltG [Gammaproteobacteria bacterium]|nr:endolytic transglycosylase MltG [Gammaproteobacteria bacterium]
MLFKSKIKLLISLTIIVMLYFVWDSYRFMQTAMNLPESGLNYTFQRGSSASHLLRELSSKKIISHPFYFKLWGKLSGKSKKLQAGEYVFEKGLTPFQLLNKMDKGEVKLYAFSIIEGWNFKQLLQAVQSDKNLVHKLAKNISNESVMHSLGYAGIHPEGRFFPDTYHYPVGTTDIQFLKRAYQQMEQHLQKEWDNRESGLPLKNAYEALTLASIVEKESAEPSERPVIAGVFVNRLFKNMRLQTDPTVIYGLGDAYKGDIRFRHLREDTPYNTYTRKGLPPTPIAMPGLESIRAALNPQATEYLYFVATGEGGRHYFSSTNDEHQRAVTKYQRYKRKKNNK